MPESVRADRENMEYDVVFIGAGPSGLSCAIRLKQLAEEKRNKEQAEKLRKQKEVKMLTNTKTEKNVSTFLEEEIIIEQQEKIQRNPELDGLNKIERTIKEMKQMEIRLGRPIVPHRDIVESDESDFDSQSATKETDILIRPSQKSPFENYEEKREILDVFLIQMERNHID